MKVLVGHCIRCGSVPQLNLDMGKFGLVPLCTVCWTGLAMCLRKDIALWENSKDWMIELHNARILKEKIEEDIVNQQKEIREQTELKREDRAMKLLDAIHTIMD